MLSGGIRLIDAHPSFRKINTTFPLAPFGFLIKQANKYGQLKDWLLKIMAQTLISFKLYRSRHYQMLVPNTLTILIATLKTGILLFAHGLEY